MYTNDSGIDGCVDLALIWYREEEIPAYKTKFNLADRFENNQAKVLAILKVVEWLEKLEIKKLRLLLLILIEKCLCNCKETIPIKSRTANESRLKLKSLKTETGQKLNLQWIKTHF